MIIVNNNEEMRMMRVIFTLKSGKSIVSTMTEDVCFDIYNQWNKYNKSNKEDEMKELESPINIPESLNKEQLDNIKNELDKKIKDYKKIKKDLIDLKNELKSLDKIVIKKVKDNKFTEITSILIDDIVAVQVSSAKNEE